MEQGEIDEAFFEHFPLTHYPWFDDPAQQESVEVVRERIRELKRRGVRMVNPSFSLIIRPAPYTLAGKAILAEEELEKAVMYDIEGNRIPMLEEYIGYQLHSTKAFLDELLLSIRAACGRRIPFSINGFNFEAGNNIDLHLTDHVSMEISHSTMPGDDFHAGHLADGAGFQTSKRSLRDQAPRQCQLGCREALHLNLARQ